MNLTRVAAYGGAAIVGGVAAVVSFGHLRAVAMVAGEAPLAATLLPVSVDGLLVSAAAVMVWDRQTGHSARVSARVAFAAGCAATVGGNLASASPTVLGWAVASWAPLALLLVTEMLVRHGRTRPAEVATATRTAPATGGDNHDGDKRPSATAARVAAAMAEHPGASVSQLARVTGLSRATVRRHANGHQSATVPAQQGDIVT